MSLHLKPWQRAALAVLLVATAQAWLAWRSVRDPGIAFLPGDARAEWILFPNPPRIQAHRIASLDTVFRREFTLDAAPGSAQLLVTAFKRFRLQVNGKPVELPATRNWKEPAQVDVRSLLLSGTNTIAATVINDDGPPALWLALVTDQLTLRSDAEWGYSCAGSAWRRAVPATQLRFLGPASLPGRDRSTFRSLAAVLPVWAAFAVIAVAIGATRQRWSDWLGRLSAATGFAGAEACALWMAAAIPLVLLCFHNSRFLPGADGFDGPSHIAYIRYLQDHRQLPWANEGFEMYQPPLYYGFCAMTLSALGLSAGSETGVAVLRGFGLFMGVAQCGLILLCLRLLLPNRRSAQLAGLALAVFLPAHLCLMNYITNETLEALLVSAVFYLCLFLLKRETVSWPGFALLGLALGAAMLTKFTAIIAAPFVLVALGAKLAARRLPLAVQLRTLGVTLAVAFAVSGWFYLRAWSHYGQPLVGNWGPAAGLPWWQDNGYHTAADFWRFGRSLVHPWFSGFAGFADGIYSTLWGDGLCSGVGNAIYRPPWNYDLMGAGYLLALVPTFLVLSGMALTLLRWVRKPSAELFVLAGVSGAVALGLVFMSLKVPSHAQEKAFYGLCLFVPFCFFGAAGWEWLTQGRRWRQFTLGCVLLVWALNCVAALWVRGDSAPALIYPVLRNPSPQQYGSVLTEFTKAATADPADGEARRLMARTLLRMGRADDALRVAEQGVQAAPDNSLCHLQLGIILAARGQFAPAIAEARRATETDPDNAEAFHSLSLWLATSGHPDDAVAAARDGLAVAPGEPALHDTLAVLLGQKDDLTGAAAHFNYALKIEPDYAPAHLHFGRLLVEKAVFEQGRTHLQEALRLNPADSEAHYYLARALLGLGDSAGALAQLQESLRLSPDSSETLGELAWLLATHPDASLRNGPEAVRIAEHACSLVNRKSPELLGTLAAAYAEAGRLPNATKTAQEALALAQSSGDQDGVALNQKLLASFQAGHAYRQDPKPATP